MSDIEERLRDAHPVSQQYAAGSNLLLEAASEIGQLRARVAMLESDMDLIRQIAQHHTLDTEVHRIASRHQDGEAWLLRQKAEAVEECRSSMTDLESHFKFSGEEKDCMKLAYQHCSNEAQSLRQAADEMEKTNEQK